MQASPRVARRERDRANSAPVGRVHARRSAPTPRFEFAASSSSAYAPKGGLKFAKFIQAHMNESI